MVSSTPMRPTATTSAWAFHGPDLCSGRPCPLHAPSDHPLVDAPVLMPVTADDLVLERLCQHRIAHPDPDSVALADILDPTREGEHGIHPCDGCCGAQR